MFASLGDIVFTVSDKEILTFSKFKRSTGAKYQTHTRIGQPPLLEFISENVDTITFNINLSAFQGLNPKKEMDKIDTAMREKTMLRFLLGKEQIGSYRWVITKADYTAKHIDNKGNFLDVDVSLSLSSYNKR